MSFTVDDFQDLLRLLEQRPEWRADLRRHVLTEELLALPALVRELADGQAALTRQVEALAAAQARTEQRVDELAAAQARTEQRVDELAAAQARTEQRIDELAAAQARTEQRVSELAAAQARTAEHLDALAVAQGRTEAEVGALADRVGALADRVGALDGEVLELRYARQAPAYFARLARRLRTVEPAALADLLDEAVEAGRLVEAERGDLLLADLVLSGRRREDGAEVYFLAEVSAGIGPGDVQRAADRAVALAKLGRPVVPVVAGRSITAEAAALARSRGVWQVLDGKTDPPGQL